jgi:hypothetical protein
MTFLPFNLLRHCCCALARIVRLVRLVRGFVKMPVNHWAGLDRHETCMPVDEFLLDGVRSGGRKFAAANPQRLYDTC